VIELSDATFDAKLASVGTIAVVEFTAPWCGHCAKLLPEFAAAAKKAPAGVAYAKVDVEASPLLKERFAVESFPQILIFERGAYTPAHARDYGGGRSAAALSDLAARLVSAPVSALPPPTSSAAAFDLTAWAREKGSTGGVAYLLVDDGPGAAAAAEAQELRDAFGAAARGLREQLTFASFASAATARASLRAALGEAAPPALESARAPFVARFEAGEPGALQLLDAAMLRALASGAGGAGASGSAASAYRLPAGKRRRADLAASPAIEALSGWALHFRLPTVVALGVDNFARLANEPGRLLAIVCHDPADGGGAGIDSASGGDAARPSATDSYLRALRRLAVPATSSLPQHVRDRFVFATIDHKPFRPFLEQFKVTHCPKLVVLDIAKKAFWEDDSVVEE